MQLDPVTRCQTEFAAAEMAADIGDDDAESGEAFNEAFAVLTETKPVSMQDAVSRLRFMAFVGERYAGCEGIGESVRAGMIQVAAWLALAATKCFLSDDATRRKHL